MACCQRCQCYTVGYPLPALSRMSAPFHKLFSLSVERLRVASACAYKGWAGVGCLGAWSWLVCVAPHLWVSSYRSGFIGRASSATDSEGSSLECLHPMHRMYSVFLCLLGNRCTTERCCSTTTRSTTLATLAFAPAASPATWTATATLVRIVSLCLGR